MEDDRHPWAIPLSTYTYAIAYRRDLLEQAGLDGSDSFCDTLRARRNRLQAGRTELCREHAWLMPYVPFPFNDFVHTAASWIWSSGGHLIDNRGKQVLFDSPATLAGLKAYFKLLRRQPNANLISGR